MGRMKINGVTLCYKGNDMLSLAWNLQHTVSEICLQEIIAYWEEHNQDGMVKIPYIDEKDKTCFKLNFIENGIFEFQYFNRDQYGKLRFYGNWSYDPGVITYVDESDLAPIHGLLWLADYIINGIF